MPPAPTPAAALRARKRSLVWLTGLCLILAGVGGRAESFTTLRGETIQAQVKDLFGDTVFFGLKDTTLSIRLADLDDASLRKVAHFLQSRPTESPVWAKSTSAVAKSVARKLLVLRNGKWVAFEPGDRPEPEFYVLYYGAYWCGPCRRFSPSLVKTYEKLKAEAGDRFEVIFISSDQDERGQTTYAKEVGMPWPVVRFPDGRENGVRLYLLPRL